MISIVSAKVAALTQGVMKTMMVTKLKIAAGMLTLSLLLGSAMVHQTWALDLPDQSRPGSSNAKEARRAFRRTSSTRYGR